MSTSRKGIFIRWPAPPAPAVSTATDAIRFRWSNGDWCIETVCMLTKRTTLTRRLSQPLRK